MLITFTIRKSLLQDNPKPNVTVEIHSGNTVYKIEGGDLKSLKSGLRLVQTFHKGNRQKLSRLLPGSSRYEAHAPEKDIDSRIECKLPEWFRNSKPKVGDVIALVLFYASRPLTNGEVTTIVAKEWRTVHLQNISKHLTTKGKHLFSYVTKDPKTRAFALNGIGKNWVSSQVIPRLMKTAGLIQRQDSV